MERRLQVMDHYINYTVSWAEAVTAAAAELGVGRRQFFNLLAKLRQLGPTRGLTPSFRNVVRKSVARDGLIEPLEIYLRKLLYVQPDARISQIEMAIIRSEEHTSELQSLMRISYAVFCLKKKNIQHITTTSPTMNNKK